MLAAHQRALSLLAVAATALHSGQIWMCTCRSCSIFHRLLLRYHTFNNSPKSNCSRPNIWGFLVKHRLRAAKFSSSRTNVAGSILCACVQLSSAEYCSSSATVVQFLSCMLLLLSACLLLKTEPPDSSFKPA